VSRRRSQLLVAAETDTAAVLEDGVWLSRCLHCKSRVGVTQRGEPVGSTTLEHIVPRTWFARRARARSKGASSPSPVPSERLDELSGPEDPRNLALACRRCNWGKGVRHDSRGPADPRAIAVVRALLARRLARFRESS
jgi:hypothetical protein